MKTAIFKNITKEPFTGYWDGKKRTFAPGAEKLLPAYLAEHYGTHLTNQILISKGDYTSTSPKDPNQVLHFKEIFDTIVTPQDGDDEDEVEMPAVAVKKEKMKTVVDGKEPQYIGSNVEDNDDEESFEGMNSSTQDNNTEE